MQKINACTQAGVIYIGTMQLQSVLGTQYKTPAVPTRVNDFLNRHALFMSHKANNRKDSNSGIQARTKADEIDHNGISAFTNTNAPLNNLQLHSNSNI